LPYRDSIDELDAPIAALTVRRDRLAAELAAGAVRSFVPERAPMTDYLTLPDDLRLPVCPAIAEAGHGGQVAV
jgi:hypothetical protein